MVKRLFISLMLLIPVTTLAGFQVVDDADTQSVAAAPVQSTADKAGSQFAALTSIGEPPVEIAVITGFGRDITLRTAINQIVPSGWQVYFKDDVATRVEKVSWKGGRRWTDVLDILARQQNFSVDVEWIRKRVFVGERKLSSAVSAADVSSTSVISKWILVSDIPVHKQFADWAEKAGWHFEWHPKKSWVVPSSSEFSGTFEDAISAAVEGLYAQGKPVKLVLWGNKFAEVVDVDAK